jgi:crotonobetainyl-CoA:carnitine CoA-transferase CaiB-like acyl-CoA transferase
VTDPASRAQPLSAFRVVDLSVDKARLTTRFLSDLGADVIRVELPEQVEAPGPLAAVRRSVQDAGKRVVRLDVTDSAGRERLWQLLATADLLVEDRPPGTLQGWGLGPDEMRDRLPRLVVVSLTDFGQTGPYRDWSATEQVHMALGGVLSRSGLPDEPPLLPPGAMATESAALQAAWAAVVALTASLDSGVGDHVDVSVLEATALAFDPVFGIGGTAAAGTTAAEGPRGRPDARHLYPIYRCQDGWVRLCVLAPRQWQGMLRWLGEPADLSDPALSRVSARHRNRDVITTHVAHLMADRTRTQIVAEGADHGVPTAALLDPSEVLTAGHFQQVQAFARAPFDDGLTVAVAASPVVFDRAISPVRQPADAELEPVVSERGRTPRLAGDGATGRRPLEGVRVLDLGIIVVGAEAGRLLADMGAEVIKVENQAFPDGSRQSARPGQMSTTFAWGHRNKLGLGLNLRDPAGVELFLRLVATSDVVLANFKPGTLESLGIGYDRLAEINPGIVVAESSAYGPEGPWSRRMGYGPLVRAETAISGLWRYPDLRDGHSDASTVYPDHIAARVIATGVVAKLLERRRTGRGGHLSVAQAQVILYSYAAQFALESLHPGSLVAVGNEIPGDAPRGVFPCAGDDEWLVVTIRGDEDFRRLAKATGRPDIADDPRFAAAAGRVADRAVLEGQLALWTAARPPREAMTRLQEAGVPAGMMHRVIDYAEDPHLTSRGILDEMQHPLLPGPFPGERGPARFQAIPEPDRRPAPLAGEHTRNLARRLLGLADDEINRLLATGVLEETPAAVAQAG